MFSKKITADEWVDEKTNILNKVIQDHYDTVMKEIKLPEEGLINFPYHDAIRIYHDSLEVFSTSTPSTEKTKEEWKVLFDIFILDQLKDYNKDLMMKMFSILAGKMDKKEAE